ncbi:hypothetical protein [Streptomyces sp. SAI-149]|uniref:hypothetical protein n=1 Tax=Streptomyces sp. SAI-149 TaxID=2940542 RepID=UPI00247435B9|nr:hypothetical protein [Streptomyces sp. SAI-149]MDH6502430.1 hypothetical protein [Streptomyces sp. SAI-149]
MPQEHDQPPRFLTEPTALIAEVVLAIEPELSPAVVAEAVASTAKMKPRHRKLAEALSRDPELLTSGRPEGPVTIQKLVRALLAVGATRVVLPRCAHCGKQHRLPSLDGDQRICAYCQMKQAAAANPCVICGRAAHVASHDHLGRPRCALHPDSGSQDAVDVVCDHAAAVDPGLARDEVAAAVRATCQMPAHQRQLALALDVNPRLLTGEGAYGPHKLILLIEDLLARGARNIVLPACPFCGTDRKLRHVLDGQRACRACYEKFRLMPCSRCGRAKPVATRTVDDQPLCHPCTRADPINHEPCTSCGRTVNIVRRDGDQRLCGRCFRPPTAICADCGRTRPCYFAQSEAPRCEACTSRLRPPQTCSRCGNERSVKARLPDGGPLCHSCIRVPVPCHICGRSKPLTGRGPNGEALCRVCYDKHPIARRDCVQCGVLERLYHHGLCNSCALDRQLTGLLGGPDGIVRPDLEPVFQCLHRGNPLSLLYWLREPVPRRLLAALAAEKGPVTHDLLDGLGHPVKAVRHLRAALAADGVLPARDERLAELEGWLPRAVARIEDPRERQVVRGFATWHHLRRLRRDAEKRPVTVHQAVVVRREVKAAIQLVAWLRARSTSLATCTQHDIDDWLATDIWVRYLARTFLVWSVRNRHAHRVLIPIPPMDASMVIIEQDQRWAHVRRLVKGDGVDTTTRVAGLLLLLFAQPLSRTSRIRLDQVTRTEDGVALTLGSHPTELPPPLDSLVLELVQQRHGYSTLGRSDDHPWLFPGTAGGQPISSRQLMRKLTALGIHARPARNTTLMELSAELPAVVLSRLLGLHINRAEKWTKEAGSTRADYAAELSRRKAFRKSQ